MTEEGLRRNQRTILVMYGKGLRNTISGEGWNEN